MQRRWSDLIIRRDREGLGVEGDANGETEEEDRVLEEKKEVSRKQSHNSVLRVESSSSRRKKLEMEMEMDER